MTTTTRRGKKDNSRLRLRHVDDGAAHAADEDHAALCLALHEVAGDGSGEEVGAVDVDGEQLAHALDGVVSGVVVLCEARGRDQVVDLAVLREDVGDARGDRVLVRHVGVVGRHLGGPCAAVSVATDPDRCTGPAEGGLERLTSLRSGCPS